MPDPITIKMLQATGKLSILMILMFNAATALAQQTPSLVAETGNTSDDGHIRLVWTKIQPEGNYEIQKSVDPDFSQPKTIYEGPDLATFVSGLRDGTYYFRVRSSSGNWSEIVPVKVQHHSLQLAFTLFTLGGIVFLLTVFVVIKGSLQARKNDT